VTHTHTAVSDEHTNTLIHTHTHTCTQTHTAESDKEGTDPLEAILSWRPKLQGWMARAQKSTALESTPVSDEKVGGPAFKCCLGLQAAFLLKPAIPAGLWNNLLFQLKPAIPAGLWNNLQFCVVTHDPKWIIVLGEFPEWIIVQTSFLILCQEGTALYILTLILTLNPKTAEATTYCVHMDCDAGQLLGRPARLLPTQPWLATAKSLPGIPGGQVAEQGVQASKNRAIVPVL